MIQKAYKFRLYPNQKQKELIAKTLGSCRFVYNNFLDKWNSAYKSTGKGLSYSKCSKDLPGLKSSYSWLREVDSTALQTALRHLDDSFKRFFKKQSDPPKFKSKKNPVQSYTSKFTNDNIRIEGNKIKLPKLGFVKVKQSRALGGRIISATIKRTASGKYYISLLVEKEKPKAFDSTSSEVGIDLGIKELLVLSNRDTVKNIKPYKSLEKRLAKAQRSLSRKEKGSNNYYKAKRKVARLHEKISNIRLDYLHKVTTDLVKNHSLICVEDLDVKSMLKNKHLSKSVSDVSFAKFKELLTYKADWYDKTLIKVDRHFPSSQLCSTCGHKNTKVKDLSVRKWTCPTCHARHDRDLNASLNILKEGQRINSLTLRTAGTAEIA